MDITRVMSESSGIAQGDSNLLSMGEPKGETFKSILEKSINEVNDLLTTSDQKTVGLAVGRAENLHEVAIASEKAETALKLLVQVRNKALEAYHEIMRMQV